MEEKRTKRNEYIYNPVIPTNISLSKQPSTCLVVRKILAHGILITTPREKIRHPSTGFEMEFGGVGKGRKRKNGHVVC